MADRRVRLILEAQVDRFNSNIRQARTEADGLKGSMKQMVNAPEMQQLGRHMTAFGAATVAGLGLATKAAIDWEVQWADVARRTDGTAQQLNNLEDGLRGIATELPTSHAEIAAVAAAAAQLGIGVDDVEEFTRVMIDMGVSTNMTAEEAATAMARFANVMGTPTEEMRNLGSAIVDLGNNSATTESEIMSMAQRIAGAGQAMGMTEGEVLGIAAALSSVGVEAAAGGTAISRTMYNIDSAVTSGGEALQGFADVAGLSAKEFATLWEDDAAMGLEAFVSGLARVAEEGGSVQETLAGLGINEVRTVSALTQMASAGDFLADAIGRGNEAFGEASALGTEAGYVYDTVASQIKAFWSNVQDAAITLGQVFLPVLEASVKGLSEAVSAFAAMPGPVQATIGVVALLAGGLALLAGGAILLAPSLMASATALGALGLTAATTTRLLGGLGRGAVGLATAFAIVGTAVAGAKLLMTDFDYGVDDARRAMEQGAVAAVEFEGNIWGVGRGFENMGEALALTQDLNPLEKFSKWGAGILGLENSLTRAEDAANANDQAMAAMLSEGNIDGVADAMRQLAAEAEREEVAFTAIAHEAMPALSGALQDAGTNMDEFMAALGLQNGYMDAATGKWVEGEITLAELRDRMSDSEEAALAAALGVDELDDAMLGAVGGGDELATALEEVGLAADGTIESLETFLAVLFETGMLTMSARDAQFAFEEQVRSMDEAVQAATDSLAAEHEAKGMSAEAAAALAAEQMALGEALNKSATDFDMTTSAGKAAQDQFSATMDSGYRMAEAMAANGASQEELQGALRNTYDGMVAAAESFGMSEGAARDLTREVLGIPDGVTIESWMSTEAEETANALGLALDRQDGRVTRSSHIHTIIEQRRKSGNNSGARDLERAAYGQGRQNSGGAVHGAGTGTSDEILRWLSNGEHVLDARDVQLMGGQSAVYDFRRSLADGSQAERPAGRDMQPASGGAASQARQFAEAMSSSGGGSGGGLNVGDINISGIVPAEVERGLQRAIFGELQRQGLPVGNPG